MTVRVKICGITNQEDAEVAAEAGADALGFVFYRKSPRFVTPEDAAKIISSLPPFISKVGVFVDERPDEIARSAAVSGIDTVQLHGQENPEYCRSVGLPIIKAFAIKSEQSLAAIPLFAVSGFLLDSYVPGQSGGTGTVFNWELAVEAKRYGRPLILAGGLTPENIQEAVQFVRPFAVDVSSGVEQSPKRKDAQKIQLFISRAKAA